MIFCLGGSSHAPLGYLLLFCIIPGPLVCEAIKCHCDNHHCPNQGTVACDDKVGCAVWKIGRNISWGCSPLSWKGRWMQCLQQKMGTPDNCVKGTWSHFLAACGSVPVDHPMSFGMDTEFQICHCDHVDLCNTAEKNSTSKAMTAIAKLDVIPLDCVIVFWQAVIVVGSLFAIFSILYRLPLQKQKSKLCGLVVLLIYWTLLSYFLAIRHIVKK